MPSNPVIVVPAFRRPAALRRLLQSIRSAYYETTPRVILSLEAGPASEVRELAMGFKGAMPNVEVREHDERLGLRRHILECGDYALEHGSVVVLEDDLLVDRYFHLFANRALDFYWHHDAVAGIALYSPHFNEFAGLPFAPMHNGYDTYPIQTPCSWGQAWTATQWSAFRDWYARATEQDVTGTLRLPSAVRRWSESSWKKYYAAYLVLSGRYFIYPYQSFTTNCSDAGGTHLTAQSDRFQVPLASQNRSIPDFHFWMPGQPPAISYDAFLEPGGVELFEALGMPPEDLMIDTLGTKPIELVKTKPYVLTSRPVRAALRRFPLSFRPVELNLSFPEASNGGSYISLAKTSEILTGNHRTLEMYSYYTNFDLTSLRFSLTVLKALPVAIHSRLFRHGL